MHMKTVLVVSCIFLLTGIAVWAVLSHPAFGLYRSQDRQLLMQSPNRRNGQFCNQVPTPQFTGNTNMFKAMRAMLSSRQTNRVPAQPVAAVKTDLKALSPDSDWLVWFGHSSYMFSIGSNRVLVDPVLTTEFPSSVMMKPFPGTDIYHPADLPDVDLLIITHEHWDHMDYGTLRDIRDRVGHVVCPLGIASYLRLWGYDSSRITEMDWYDQSSPATSKLPMAITCLPSRHFSNRLFGRNQTLWASFMVECAGRKVYIGGDGGYDGRFRDIRDRFGEVDLAFLENGQYNDNWKYIHTTPDDLGKVIADLRPKRTFTVHHDKFALAMHPWDEPDSVAHDIADQQKITLLDSPIGTVVAW